MKLFLAFCVAICISSCGKKAPREIPAFDVLLLDSTTLLNTRDIPTGRPVLFMYFQPDCKHCQEETIKLVKNMDAFKDVQIYYISPSPISEVKLFYDLCGLKKFSNVTFAVDYKLYFYEQYKPTTTPYQAVYDRSKKLVDYFDGGTKLTRLMKLVHKG
ncbi:TlpA family protein disulfide reductase [Chitinophaga terrae (ex Kim and Jung 2007)]|uniref:TlpA family protein disulfide reductase n=1 Tax=Chitinophaga terrae (ex Kim and Jung 2007) TaxID=408074 RepID=UPI0027D8B555|nr:redoxin domain-containing protein [Chitinophaga terrae (ex Kim and Jung 2007)]